MNKNRLSCGILIEHQGKLLLGHATMTPRWDIPKGGIEEGETPKQAALRETLEEFGLDLSQEILEDLGVHPYIQYKKDLHLFKLSLANEIDTKKCHCTAFIETPKGNIPEMDSFQWIPIEKAEQYLGKSMVALFKKLKIIPETVTPKIINKMSP